MPDYSTALEGNTVSRKVIIGLDGVPHSLIADLAEKGVMPNMRDIIQKSAFRQMASSIPEISSVAWSSIITGKNPGEHGIYGFSDIAPDSYRVFFPNFSNLKAQPFWMDRLHGRSVIINVPATYPAAPLDGTLIAGFVALDMERAVYPESLAGRLEEMEYQIDVDSGKAHLSMELFLRHLNKTLNSRIAAYRYLWDSTNWDNFMLVFTGTDRLSHFLWNAYEDEYHRFHEDFLHHFHQIDEAIGEIYSRLDDDDLLIMLSDHGFERLDKSVNVNFYMRENGFLKWEKNPPTDTPKDSVISLLDRFFNGQYEFKSGSHIVVRDDRLKDLPDYGPDGSFDIPIKGGQRVKGYYLNRLARTIRLLEEMET